MTIFQNLVIKIFWNLAEFLLTSQFMWRMLENVNQTEEFRRIFCCSVIHYFLKKLKNSPLECHQIGITRSDLFIASFVQNKKKS